MKTRTPGLALALGLILAAAGVLAAEQAAVSFDELDADHDGYVTDEEIGNYMALGRDWDLADRNDDNRIDREEYQHFLTGRTEQVAAPTPSFQSLDSDGDGYITEDELGNYMDLARDWEPADRNDDGRLDRAEFSAFQEGAPSE